MSHKDKPRGDDFWLDFVLSFIALGTVALFLFFVWLLVLPFRALKFVLWGRA